jgi:hypothetical protein
VRALLGVVALALIVTGCSDEGDPPADETRSAPASSASSASTEPVPPTSGPPKPPRLRLKAAQRTLTRAQQGVYNLNVWSAGDDRQVMLSERAYFNVPGGVVDILRTMQNPAPAKGEERSFRMRIRSSPRTSFLQMSDWGRWDGCWAELTPDLLAEQGIDISGTPNIPVPVSVVLGATFPRDTTPALARVPDARSAIPALSKAEQGEDEVTVTIDAVTALQMIGITGSALLELDPAAAKVRVPLTLRYFAEYPDLVEKVTVWGIHIAQALQESDAEVDPLLPTAAAALFAEARFGPSTTPVTFERPPAAELLPPRATKDQTCPAQS